MPKIPNDMSAAGVKRRAILTEASKAMARAEPARPIPAPKPRVAKKRSSAPKRPKSRKPRRHDRPAKADNVA